jgi:hypothetical protein
LAKSESQNKGPASSLQVRFSGERHDAFFRSGVISYRPLSGVANEKRRRDEQNFQREVLLDRLSLAPYHKVLTGLEPRISGERLASKDRNVEL